MQWLAGGEKEEQKDKGKGLLADKVVSDVLIVARKVMHCGERWCHWRWSKRGGNGGWQRRRKEN